MQQHPILFAIRYVNIQFDKEANNILKPYDLSVSQYKVLLYLYHRPPFTVRQVDIERYYNITNPTVTGILHSLEKKGLIERKTNPDDERSKVISLTPRAYVMQDDLTELGSQLESILTHSLTDDEREQLRVLLTKMMENMESR